MPDKIKLSKFMPQLLARCIVLSPPCTVKLDRWEIDGVTGAGISQRWVTAFGDEVSFRLTFGHPRRRTKTGQIIWDKKKPMPPEVVVTTSSTHREPARSMVLAKLLSDVSLFALSMEAFAKLYKVIDDA